VNAIVGPERLGRMDVIMAGDDVSKKKPDPLIYNLAREKVCACIVYRCSPRHSPTLYRVALLDTCVCVCVCMRMQTWLISHQPTRPQNNILGP